jgi:hypothetical protein
MKNITKHTRKNKEDSNKYKHICCWQKRRNAIVEMIVSLKIICECNKIPVRVPEYCFNIPPQSSSKEITYKGIIMENMPCQNQSM